MNKRKLSNCLIILLFVAYMVLYKTYLFDTYLKIIDSLTASFLLIIVFISFQLLGFRKDKNNLIKKSINQIVLYTIIVFFCVIYAFGFKTGFLKNAYSLTLPSIVENIIAPLTILICFEIFRYIFITANKDDSRNYTYLITIVLAVFEICIHSKGNPFSGDLITIFKSFSTTYIPIIIKNMLLSYLTNEAGFKPSLLYRLILELYIYIMPIQPNLGDYLESVEGIIVPLIIYIFTSRTIEEYYKTKEEKQDTKVNKKWFNTIDIPFIVIFAILIALISDFFPHQLIGIASQSMEPNINRGDAVLVYKILKDQDLNKGDIVAYKSSKKIIVHRIVKKDCSSGTCYYHTKGDANNVSDEKKLTIKNIKGKVLFKIKYIAYPSVWIMEWLGRN